MILRVTHFGESILREPGKPVEHFDTALRELAQNMIETMHAEEGIGLAAQQIDRALRLFVVDLSVLSEIDFDYRLDGKRPPLDLIMPHVFVNAVLTPLPGRALLAEEGCLSFPGIRGDVPRAPAVRVTYQDLDGHAHELETDGWFARVLQHEYDHTEGILFIDHMENRARRMLEPRLKRLKCATEESFGTP